jgi:hypothetical protein
LTERRRQIVRATGLALVAGLGWGSEALPAPAVRVLGAEEILAEHVEVRDGRLWLAVPGVPEWELEADERSLVPSPAAIRTEDAQDACKAIALPFRDRIAVTLLLLPFPRRLLPNSSAEDSIIYLSPGAQPYTRRQVHFLVAHEMGHCLHLQRLADRDSAGWDDYRHLRGITDATRFSAFGRHADRPHEIFAEDFRYLFGGPDANYAGSIENDELALPDAVPGLREFFLGLTAEPWAALAPAAARLVVTPNPTTGETLIRATWPRTGVNAGGPAAYRLVILDVAGRTVRSLGAGIAGPSGVEAIWDGRLDGGEVAPAGIYFADLSAPGGIAGARIVLIR